MTPARVVRSRRLRSPALSAAAAPLPPQTAPEKFCKRTVGHNLHIHVEAIETSFCGGRRTEEASVSHGKLLFRLGAVRVVDNQASGEACSHGLLSQQFQLQETKLTCQWWQQVNHQSDRRLCVLAVGSQQRKEHSHSRAKSNTPTCWLFSGYTCNAARAPRA